jgi:hypothetical protein
MATRHELANDLDYSATFGRAIQQSAVEYHSVNTGYSSGIPDVT